MKSQREESETMDVPETEVKVTKGTSPQCICVQDPFAALPPEARPRTRPRMGGLRKVTCPGCGLVYWTNRKTDLCPECEKKGVRLPESGEEG